MDGNYKELLKVEEVAEYLDIGPVTIYRWCREGRLPCIKLGKEWRIRRTALEDFLRRAEQGQSLASRLRTFLHIPDHVIAIVETPDLMQWLDAAFFQVGEAHGATLIKFYTGETALVHELHAALIRNGLDVDRLEAAGRFQFIQEVDPIGGRGQALRQLDAQVEGEGRSIWASFDWVRQVGLDEALGQQEALRQIIDATSLVVLTQVLEHIVDEWPAASRRRVRHAHHGMIMLSEEHLSLSRVLPLPST